MDIRVIIREPGGDSRAPQIISVSGNESVADLNASILSEYNNLDHSIKWIYLGHTIPDLLPENLESGSTMHVVIRKTSTPFREPHGSATQPDAPSDVDKHLLIFIHCVFAIFLAVVWKQYIETPSLFTSLSATVLIGLSCIFLVSVSQQLYSQ